MSRYTGTITTTGKSEAIRLEKALFKSHPEFRQKAKIRADVIGPGTMLISVADAPEAANDADPVMEAFLSFLADDMQRHPERLNLLPKKSIAKARALTRRVKVGADEELPDDVTL